MTADWFNKTSKNNDSYNIGTKDGDSRSIDFLTAYIKNTTTTSFERYAAIGIGSLAAEYGANHAFNSSNLLFNSTSLNDTNQLNWGVLQQPLEGRIGAIAEILLVGRTWIKVPDDYLTGSKYIGVSGTIVTGLPYGKAAVLAESSYPTSKKIVLAVLGAFSSGGIINGKTDESGIAGMSGSTMNSGSVTRYKVNPITGALTSTNKTDIVFNPVEANVGANRFIVYEMSVDGCLEVIVESCSIVSS